ncbi:MAG: hypothetical protein J6Y28_09065 [Acholeplasmatales bacterium]|nr:hypothetical protein [Acholeplasmatales bacterium]
MAKKYEKVKLGLPAYLTFAAFLVAIIIMVIILIPSKKSKIRDKFRGTYTETTSQGQQENETKYYDVGEDHILKMYSFSNLKKQLKKDKYTYYMYGNTKSVDFCKDVCEINKLGKELGIEKLIIIDSNDLSDNQKEYLRDRLKKFNNNVKSIEKMPKEDLWVVKNDEVVNCYSHEDYENLSLTMVAKYHIFSFKNE